MKLFQQMHFLYYIDVFPIETDWSGIYSQISCMSIFYTISLKAKYFEILKIGGLSITLTKVPFEESLFTLQSYLQRLCTVIPGMQDQLVCT